MKLETVMQGLLAGGLTLTIFLGDQLITSLKDVSKATNDLAATTTVNLDKVSDRIGDLGVNLAVITEKVLEHERKIMDSQERLRHLENRNRGRP